MTQEDLQRDVVTLESMRADAGFSHVQDTLDRAIETARILASMSDEQRAYLVEHSTAIAECDEVDAAHDEFVFGMVEVLPPVITADAHRKVARLMGGAT